MPPCKAKSIRVQQESSILDQFTLYLDKKVNNLIKWQIVRQIKDVNN